MEEKVEERMVEVRMEVRDYARRRAEKKREKELKMREDILKKQREKHQLLLVSSIFYLRPLHDFLFCSNYALQITREPLR